MSKCPNCKIWEIRNDDFYCSLCGFELLRLEFSGDSRIYIDPHYPKGQCKIKVRNIGFVKAKISLIPSYLKPNYTKIDKLNDIFLLEPQSEKLISVPFDLSNVNTRIAEIGVKFNFEKGEKEFVFNIYPLPVIELSKKEFTVIKKSNRPMEILLQLCSRYAPIFLEKIEIIEDGKLIFSKEIHTDISLNRYIPVPIEIPFSASGILKLNFYCRGIPEPYSADIKLNLITPPEIKFLQEVQTEEEKINLEVPTLLVNMYAGEDDKTFSFLLKNYSNYNLQINNFYFNSNEDFSVRLIEPKETILLKPEEEARVTLEVSLSKRADKEAIQTYEFFISYKIEEVPDLEDTLGPYKLTLKIENLAPYNDFIALDFGTSTSSAVWKIPSEGIPLDGKSDIIFSNILFQEYIPTADPPFRWIIGQKAKYLGALPSSRPFLVKAVKTKIGIFPSISLPFPPENPKITPEEICKYIFLDLSKRIEKAIRLKPKKLILSMPIRFNFEQRRKLFNACKEAFNLDNEDLMTVDESIAAGLFYILGFGTKEFPNGKYTLMLIDFGGGTTDVSIFLVENEESRVKRMEVIGSWGDEKLGGEDITKNIAILLANKFILVSENLQREPDILEIRALEDEAEDLKILISEICNFLGDKSIGNVNPNEAESLARKFFDEKIKYIKHTDPVNYSFVRLFGWKNEKEIINDLKSLIINGKLSVLSEDYPNVSTGISVSYQEIIDIYKNAILPFTKNLKRLLEILNCSKIDKILLAGQSCRFRYIKELLKSELGENVDYIRDMDGNILMKECVARGAFLYCYYIKSGLMELKGQDRLFRRLGLLEGGERFVELLPFNAEPGTEKEFIWVRLEEFMRIYEHRNLEKEGREGVIIYKEFRVPEEIKRGEKLTLKIKYEGQGDIKIYVKTEDNRWILLESK